MSELKVSVIMPSYLGYYENCASNREFKFKRAVDSFLKQTYTNIELIIISDGCDITENIYNELYNDKDNIFFHKIDKCELFSGSPRNKGIELSNGDYICYLDSDDFLSSTHIEVMLNKLKGFDWGFFNDTIVYEYISYDNYKSYNRRNIILLNRVGTSSIIHKKNGILWNTGYGHDWEFIKQLRDKFPKYKKIKGRYNICHIPNKIDV